MISLRSYLVQLTIISLLMASTNSHAQSRYDQNKAQVQAKARGNANAAQATEMAKKANIYKKIGPVIARGRSLAAAMVYTCGDEIYFPRHRLKILGQPLNWKNLYSVSESVESRTSGDSKRLNTGIVESIFVSIKWKILARDKRIVWWDHDANQWGWGSIIGNFGSTSEPDGALSEKALAFTVHIMEGGSYEIDYGNENFSLLPSESYFSTGPSTKQKKLHFIFAKFIEGNAPKPDMFKYDCPLLRQTGYGAYRGVFDFIDLEKFALAGVQFEAERLVSKTAPRPKNNLERWVGSHDYPFAAAGGFFSVSAGSVGYKLVVNSDGRVSECAITKTSGSPLVDQVTCRAVMSQARFYPALDGVGEPTTGEYSGTVSWGRPASSSNGGVSEACVQRFVDKGWVVRREQAEQWCR